MAEEFKEEDTTLKAKWFELMGRWENGGQKQKTFCDNEGVSYVQFGYWRTLYLKSRGKNKSRFKRIDLKHSSPPSAGQIQLALPNGLRMVVSAGVGEKELMAVLRCASSC